MYRLGSLPGRRTMLPYITWDHLGTSIPKVVLRNQNDEGLITRIPLEVCIQAALDLG